MKKHKAYHPLPINRGYTVDDRSIKVSCESCGDLFDIDRDWVTRHIAARRRRVGQERARRYYSTRQLNDLEQQVDDEERALLAHLKRRRQT